MPLRRVHVRSAHDGASETLHTLDMDAVSRGCAHGFMHVSRRLLMCELRALLHKEDILYETCVLGIEEHEMKQLVTVSYVQPNSSKAVKFVTSRVLIGADGAGSFTRTFVAGGSQGGGGFSGEVCYRGIVNFKALQKEGRDVSVLKRLLKRDGDGDVMRIDCGAGIHSSYGFLNRSNDMAYWWVKMVAREMQPMEKFRLHCSHVLNMLKDASAKEDCHQVEVEERGGAKRWCTPRIALIGDAAHVIPQKLGFASSLAIEDAFVLATLLATFWQWPDGHLEAFYEFESCRRPHVEGIVKEVTCWLLLGKISRRTAVWMRDFLIRCVPVCMLQYVLRKHCFDIEPHVMNFKKTAQRVVTNRVN